MDAQTEFSDILVYRVKTEFTTRQSDLQVQNIYEHNLKQTQNAVPTVGTLSDHLT